MGAGAVAGGAAAVVVGRRAGSEGDAGAGGRRWISTMTRTPDAL